MAGLPPLPPGFVLDAPIIPPAPARPADPYKLLKDEGFTFTNGYRTDADTARIRAQGYKPATNSLHKAGDGVDVDHPTLSRSQQTRRLKQLFGGWEGAFIDDEGHHRHVQLPGWGEAPGTPGTRNSGLPPLPPGFELQQRGSLTAGNFMEAPPALSEKDARVATIKQNGFPPAREAYLVRNVEAEYGGFNFSPEQAETLRQYVAKAASPDDLDAFARRLSGGRAGLTNAAQVFHDFAKLGTLPPGVVAAKPVPAGTPETPGLAERLIAPVNEGIADVLGAPVDLVTAGLNAFGVGIERPFLGSEMIRDNMRSLGFGQTSEAYAPQSRLEGYGQALTRGVGQAVLPTVGLPAAGGGLALRGASALTQASPVRSAARQLLVDTAKRPGVAAVAEIAGGAGSGLGAQTARDVAPGNALAEVAGATIGGIGAGGLAAIGAVRRGARPAPVVRDGVEVGPFGPVHADLADDYPAALARMRADGSGEVPGAIKHPELGDVDLVWGNDNYGLAKIVAKHPEVVDDLPAIVERLPVKQTPADTGNGRYVLEDDVHRAVISPDFDGDPKRWLITAYERKGAPGGQTSRRDPLLPDGGSTGVGAVDDVRLSGLADNGLPPIPEGFALDDASAGMRADDVLPSLASPARAVDRIDVASLPPIPNGFVLDEGAAALGGTLGRTRPIGERLPAEDIAALARGVDPEDVTPIPSNRIESPDEVPGSIVQIEGPGELGRSPKRPEGFAQYMRRTLAGESQSKGMPVRIDAEDAIDQGVPAELIYRNPNVADKSKLQLRNPALFGTRYGRMSATQQDLRSLDLDSVDPAQWGLDSKVGQRLDPEDVADLLRRDLEGDTSALERGAAYDDWTAYQDRAAEKAEFDDRFADDPRYEQRGAPVTRGDLEAVDVPASAYEDAPRATGTIGNINLDRLENPGDVSRLIRQVREQVGGFDEASRGVVTNAETRALADELGLTPEQLLKRRRGQALNAEELYATRVLVQKSREVVAGLAKSAQGGTDEQLAQFRNAWMRHVALEEHATAATAEVGRAMQSFKMLARAGDARGEAVKAYLRGGGGRETVEDAAARLVELMDEPGKASRFMRDGAKARTRDMLNEFWINSLLSGPKTHIVNMASNTLTALYTLPEHVLTAGIGKALGTPDRALLREVSKRAVGMMEGAREGLALAKHAFLTGEPSDAITKVETANYHAIPGRLGEVVRLPTRALTSADEFFKAVNRQGALNAMAYRRAQVGGGTSAERMQRFNDLVTEPDKRLRDYADNQARYLTFQSPLGTVGRSITTAVNNWPVAKLIVPFIRTPINLLKFAGERSVFAPALKEFRDAWKAGGNARNEAAARMTMGSGLSALAVSYALDGKLSGGGPTDSRERSALMNSGWQPYSMKVGDRWVSYQRFDPVSMLIGAAADFAEVGKNATAKESEDIALGLGIAVAKNVTSKTWLSGLSDFFEVLTDPERYGETWAKRMIGSLAVPALGAHIASAIDPNLREVNDYLDAVRNRVPGLSHHLLARRNVWGDEIKRGNGAGGSVLSSAYSFVSPVSSSRVKASPLLREVARLRAPLSMPQRRVRVGGVDRKLTPEQYAYYVQLAGKPAKAHLEEYVGTSDWKALTDDERRDYLADTLKETRADAREQLLDMFPALSAEPDLPPIPRGYQLPPIPPGYQLAR